MQQLECVDDVGTSGNHASLFMNLQTRHMKASFFFIQQSSKKSSRKKTHYVSALPFTMLLISTVINQILFQLRSLDRNILERKQKIKMTWLFCVRLITIAW